jgi:hypothetical protein
VEGLAPGAGLALTFAWSRLARQGFAQPLVRARDRLYRVQSSPGIAAPRRTLRVHVRPSAGSDREEPGPRELARRRRASLASLRRVIKVLLLVYSLTFYAALAVLAATEH